MVNLILGVGLQWQIYEVGDSNFVFRPKFLFFFSFIWYSILFHFTSLYKQTHEPRVLVPERGSALDPNGGKLLAYNIMRNDPMLLTFMCLWVQFILSRAHVLHGVHNSKKQKPLQVSTSQISIQFWKFLMISRQMIWAIWLNKEMPMEVKSVFYYVFFLY